MDIILMNEIFCKLCRLKKTSVQIFNESVADFLSLRKYNSKRHGELSNLSLNGWYEREGLFQGYVKSLDSILVVAYILQ